MPPHHYLAFYLWLRGVFDAMPSIHLGKHGNLEWLPGKAPALSAACLPEAVLGPVPHLYPFIVNDPGEGIQAKRRAAAVIVDHLTPPLTRAELHGELSRLESADRRILRSPPTSIRSARRVSREIVVSCAAQRLDLDLGFAATADRPTRCARSTRISAT